MKRRENEEEVRKIVREGFRRNEPLDKYNISTYYLHYLEDLTSYHLYLIPNRIPIIFLKLSLSEERESKGERFLIIPWYFISDVVWNKIDDMNISTIGQYR